MKSTFNRGRNPTYFAQCCVSQVRGNNTRDLGKRNGISRRFPTREF